MAEETDLFDWPEVLLNPSDVEEVDWNSFIDAGLNDWDVDLATLAHTQETSSELVILTPPSGSGMSEDSTEVLNNIEAISLLKTMPASVSSASVASNNNPKADKDHTSESSLSSTKALENISTLNQGLPCIPIQPRSSPEGILCQSNNNSTTSTCPSQLGPLSAPVTLMPRAKRKSMNDAGKKKVKKVRQVGSCIRCRMYNESVGIILPAESYSC